MSIECGSQITLCDLPIHFDTYKGCAHACKYCFVKRKFDITQIEKSNCIESLKRFISGKRTAITEWCDWDIPLHWGGVSDPFQPCEKKHRVSLDALKLFAETYYPFVVSTKGRLIADDEYLDLIKNSNCVAQISMICPSMDKLELGAPKYDERLKIAEKVAKNSKRLIIRIQPYFVELHSEIMKCLKQFAEAGVYGVTVEGMKFIKRKDGLVKNGSDYVYKIEDLRPRYEEMKRECHKLGLAFFCAENRLRALGDDMCCCGVKDLDGFTPNRVNLLHIFNGETPEYSEAMKKAGTGIAYHANLQETISNRAYRTMTFEEATKYYGSTHKKKLNEQFGLY